MMCFSSSYHKIMFSAVKNAKAVLISYFHSYNSFSYAEKKLWHMCTNFWINPHNGKLPSRLAPAQCQNSLAPQLLSNNNWSKTKTSISLNRVYWYDTMCHIFSCLFYFLLFISVLPVTLKINAFFFFFFSLEILMWSSFRFSVVFH